MIIYKAHHYSKNDEIIIFLTLIPCIILYFIINFKKNFKIVKVNAVTVSRPFILKQKSLFSNVKYIHIYKFE